MATEWSWLVEVSDPLGFGANPGAAQGGPPERFQALAGGFEALAAGDAALAMRRLDAEREAAAQRGDGASALLAVGLGWLAELSAYNLSPTGAGLGSVELQIRWDGPARAKAMIDRTAPVRALPGSRDARDARAWLEIVTGRLPGLAAVRDAAGSPFADMLLQLQVQQFEAARPDAAVIGPSAEAFLERSIAELFAAAKKWDEAFARLAAAAAMFEAAGDAVGQAGCLSLRGDWLVAPSGSAHVQNLVLSESPTETSDLSWAVEAVEGAREGDLEGARAAFDEAARLCEPAGGRALGAVLLRQAHVAALDDRRADRLALLERATLLFRAGGARALEQLATARRALALLEDRRAPEDREAAAAIGRWGRENGSFSFALGMGLLFTRAGRQALLREGDYERAEACFQLALALSDALGTRQRAGQTHADLAALHKAMGNHDGAGAHTGRALDAIQGDELARRAPVAAIPQRAAFLAQGLYREAQARRDAGGMERAVARMTAVAGDFGSPENPLSAAAVTGLLAETLAQAQALIPLYRAVEARDAGRDDDAERLFEQALSRAEEIAGPQRDMLAAVVHRTRRRYAEAVKAYDTYQERLQTELDTSRALLLVMQQMAPARAEIEAQALRRRSAATAFGFMVGARAYERAGAILAELEALEGPEWWRDERPWQNLATAGEMHEGLGDLGEALRHYQLAIDQLEQRRSLLSRDELKTALAGDEGVPHLYFKAVRAALGLATRAGDEAAKRAALARAFELSELGRARGLLDLLESASAARSSLDLPPDVARWRRLTGQGQIWRGLLSQARSARDVDEARVQDLSAKIEAFDEELHALGRALAERYPGIRELAPAQAKVATLDEIASLLPPGTALLQAMTLGDHLLVWAITREGMTAAPVAEIRAETLALAARRFHAACARGEALEEPRNRDAAALLTGHLVTPLAAVLEEQDRLILVPYGDLHLVPFAALPWKGGWLGRHWTLSHLPSASVLPRLSSHGARAGAESALVVGNPSRMSWSPPFGERFDLPALDFAEAEATHIAGLYGGAPLVGAAATKEAVMAGIRDHRVLHFATHGVLSAEAPLLSGIVLADGAALTVNELMATSLDADLVTLSACNTALGARTGGDEVLGLTRGLLAAGARAAVVSLWSVFDGSTAVLMSKLYDELRAEPPPGPAEALRRAQAWMIDLPPAELAKRKEALREVTQGATPPADRIHPQHWGAFLLVGL